MNPGRCAACRFLRRKCPPDCIFSPYFPPNNPQRFVAVHRIYGASNVAKLLQNLPTNLQAEAADSLYTEAEYRVQDPVYGCVGLIYLLQQEIHDTGKLLAKTQAEIAVLKLQVHHPLAVESNFMEQQLENVANLSFSDEAYAGFM